MSNKMTGTARAAERLGVDAPDPTPPLRLVTREAAAQAEHTGVWRPTSMTDMVGNQRPKMQIQHFVQAALMRKTQPGHFLLSGPPGLGKTTLAQMTAVTINQLRPGKLPIGLHVLMGSTVRTERQLIVVLSKIEEGDVLFLDECHRMGGMSEEMLGLAMEDGRITIPSKDEDGPTTMIIPPFTLVGATTAPNKLTRPLRDRFAMDVHLDYYPAKDLAEIARRAAERDGIDITSEAASAIAQIGRGTPRITLARFGTVRDYAIVDGAHRITADVVADAMDLAEIDSLGLDARDRRYLGVIARWAGRRVGLLPLTSATGLSAQEISTDIEPYLIRAGLLDPGQRGRCLTRRAYQHLWPDQQVPPLLGLT